MKMIKSLLISSFTALFFMRDFLCGSPVYSNQDILSFRAKYSIVSPITKTEGAIVFQENKGFVDEGILSSDGSLVKFKIIENFSHGIRLLTADNS